MKLVSRGYYILTFLLCLIKLIASEETSNESNDDDKSNQPHSRQKRLIWITDDGRLGNFVKFLD